MAELIWYQFRIIGKHKTTNRKRTISIIAKSLELAEQEAYKQDLLPPLETTQEEISVKEPSERQLSYAKDLGITVPENSSMEYVSYLIGSHLGSYKAPNPGLVEFAYNRNIYFSQYISKEHLYNITFDSLSNLDRVAFFVFSIYRWLSDDRHANLDTHPNVGVFYEFANQWYTDEKFMKSFNRYQGEDLRFFGTITSRNDNWETTRSAGSNRTFAYTTAATFLRDRLDTGLTRSKTFSDFTNALPINDDFDNIPSTPASFKQAKAAAGCLLPVLLALGIALILF